MSSMPTSCRTLCGVLLLRPIGMFFDSSLSETWRFDRCSRLASSPIRDVRSRDARFFRLEFTDRSVERYALKRDDTDSRIARFPHLASTEIEEDSISPMLGGCTQREVDTIDGSTVGLRDFGLDWQDDVKKQQMKGYREGKSCKQCSYVAITKMEYWEHMRCHIKGFTCPECSFVTKYKHHMNHHWLSVHDGSKPFKCKKCAYTCVSKSMLTSHLKKHSNVYPYRCVDCTYKTKFCNALKKHLRKKGHQPAMVLNADGSPNPLSIIDVYGTKRGPKQKTFSDNKTRDRSQQSDDDATTMTNDDQPGSAGPISPISPFESPVAAPCLAGTTANGTTDNAIEIDRDTINQSRPMMAFPYSDLVAAFNLSNHLLLRQDLRATDYPQRSDIFLEYTDNVGECGLGNLPISGSFVQNFGLTCLDATGDDGDDGSDVCARVNDNTGGESSAFFMSQLPFEDESTNTPLDLRKTEMIGKQQLQLQLSVTDLPRTIGTNRRKGRAIKLERRFVERVDEELPANDAESFVSATVCDESAVLTERNEIEGSDDVRTMKTIAPSMTVSIDDRLICHYCEIAFGDAAMYSVHMGYHGFNDPYTCNMCGHRSNDRLSFFLHIGRSKHT